MLKISLVVSSLVAALNAPPELISALESRLVELSKEKDPIASDSAVILATRYRRLLAFPPADAAAQEKALRALIADAQKPLPVGAKPGAMVKVDPRETPLLDGGTAESRRAALAWAIADLKRGKSQELPFGLSKVRRADLLATAEALARLFARESDPAKIAAAIQRDFDVYRSPGLPGSGDVLFTGYHEVHYAGRLERDAQHTWPVYGEPRTAGIPNAKFNRGQVAAGALDGKGLELAWFADPLDAYLLGIQGSGLVELPGGRYAKLQFAAKSGHAYKSLGKLMVREGLLKPWEMDIPSIRLVLREKPQLLRPLLDQNESQVYFKRTILETAPEPSEYMPRRTVACDQGYYPRGGVSFVALERPEPGPDGRTRAWVPHRSFVVNHDTGSAIRGPGHIDLFWGRDKQAEAIAGVTRDPGALFAILKKGTQLR